MFASFRIRFLFRLSLLFPFDTTFGQSFIHASTSDECTFVGPRKEFNVRRWFLFKRFLFCQSLNRFYFLHLYKSIRIILFRLFASFIHISDEILLIFFPVFSLFNVTSTIGNSRTNTLDSTINNGENIMLVNYCLLLLQLFSLVFRDVGLHLPMASVTMSWRRPWFFSLLSCSFALHLYVVMRFIHFFSCCSLSTLCAWFVSCSSIRVDRCYELYRLVV